MGDKLAKLGFAPVGNAPAEFSGQISAQLGKWDKLIKEAGIRLQ